VIYLINRGKIKQKYGFLKQLTIHLQKIYMFVLLILMTIIL